MIDAEAHRAEVEAWRRERYERLNRDLGWLTLSGLDWLAAGVNRVGADRSCDVVLRAGPPMAGTVTVGEDQVVADGVFTHDGEPATALELLDDEAEETTVLAIDDLRLCLIRRNGRPALRTWDLASPARRAFEGVDHWPVDLGWRLLARYEPTPGRQMDVPDVLGATATEPSPGDVVLSVGDEELRLQALPGGDAGELWLVFGDATNGAETYGGGRFLYTGPPAQGRVVVDFNRAYNPPCVFSPYATCPLPWQANRLPVRIEAGERMYVAAHG
jgi:uncharacterized protein (DUF1684 family)